MRDLFFWFGAVVNICTGVIAIGLAFMYVFDWAMGKIGRYLRSYALMIEFAFYHKEFTRWRKEVKGIE